MRAFEQLSLAAVVVLAGACGDGGSSDDGGEGLSDPYICGAPCVRAFVVVEEPWTGPTLPDERRNGTFLGGIVCFPREDPRADYPTQLDIDRQGGSIDFECDGELGLHMVGHVTRLGFTHESPESGTFGPDSTWVLSATGRMGEWLAGVMDVEGTDLLPVSKYPPGWGRAVDIGQTSGGAIGYLPAGTDTRNPSGAVRFEVEFYLPAEPAVAPPP